MNRIYWCVLHAMCTATWLLCISAEARAQTGAAATQPLTVSDAVAQALSKYPDILESDARLLEAEATVSLAKTAYLPRIDTLWQINRATHNNLYGLLLPQSVIPGVSGPALETHSNDSVWSNAVGALVSWDIVDFGRRHAGLDSARRAAEGARARRELSQLDVAAAAADSFIGVIAADATVRAADANVARVQTLLSAISTLVRNGLRPGVDESRARAELAVATNQAVLSRQGAAVARASLARAVGAAGSTIDVTQGRLAELPSAESAGQPDVAQHPAARAGLAGVEASHAREAEISSSAMPRVSVQSALAGRGSGAVVPGQPSLGNGLGLQVSNWAVGLSVSYTPLDLFSMRARRAAEVQNGRAASARYDSAVQEIREAQARAEAVLTSAIEVARNTPAGRDAAVAAENQARSRYQSGLATITEVAETQRLLAQAEADDAIARLAAWRALLAVAHVRGDLSMFLQQVQ